MDPNNKPQVQVSSSQQVGSKETKTETSTSKEEGLKKTSTTPATVNKKITTTTTNPPLTPNIKSPNQFSSPQLIARHSVYRSAFNPRLIPNYNLNTATTAGTATNGTPAVAAASAASVSYIPLPISPYKSQNGAATNNYVITIPPMQNYVVRGLFYHPAFRSITAAISSHPGAIQATRRFLISPQYIRTVVERNSTTVKQLSSTNSPGYLSAGVVCNNIPLYIVFTGSSVHLTSSPTTNTPFHNPNIPTSNSPIIQPISSSNIKLHNASQLLQKSTSILADSKPDASKKNTQFGNFTKKLNSVNILDNSTIKLTSSLNSTVPNSPNKKPLNKLSASTSTLSSFNAGKPNGNDLSSLHSDVLSETSEILFNLHDDDKAIKMDEILDNQSLSNLPFDLLNEFSPEMSEDIEKLTSELNNFSADEFLNKINAKSNVLDDIMSNIQLTQISIPTNPPSSSPSVLSTSTKSQPPSLSPFDDSNPLGSSTSSSHHFLHSSLDSDNLLQLSDILGVGIEPSSSSSPLDHSSSSPSSSLFSQIVSSPMKQSSLIDIHQLKSTNQKIQLTQSQLLKNGKLSDKKITLTTNGTGVSPSMSSPAASNSSSLSSSSFGANGLRTNKKKETSPIWSNLEKAQFQKALVKYGTSFTPISSYIPSKTSTQIRKYYHDHGGAKGMFKCLLTEHHFLKKQNLLHTFDVLLNECEKKLAEASPDGNITFDFQKKQGSNTSPKDASTHNSNGTYPNQSQLNNLIKRKRSLSSFQSTNISSVTPSNAASGSTNSNVDSFSVQLKKKQKLNPSNFQVPTSVPSIDPTASMSDSERNQYLKSKIEHIFSSNDRKEFFSNKQFEDHPFPHGNISHRLLPSSDFIDHNLSFFHASSSSSSSPSTLTHSDPLSSNFDDLPLFSEQLKNSGAQRVKTENNQDSIPIQPLYESMYDDYRKVSNLQPLHIPVGDANLSNSSSNPLPNSSDRHLSPPVLHLSPSSESINPSHDHSFPPPLLFDDALATSTHHHHDSDDLLPDLTSSSWQSMLHSTSDLFMPSSLPSSSTSHTISTPPPLLSVPSSTPSPIRLTQSTSNLFDSPSASDMNIRTTDSIITERKQAFGKEGVFNFNFVCNLVNFPLNQSKSLSPSFISVPKSSLLPPRDELAKSSEARSNKKQRQKLTSSTSSGAMDNSLQKISPSFHASPKAKNIPYALQLLTSKGKSKNPLPNHLQHHKEPTNSPVKEMPTSKLSQSVANHPQHYVNPINSFYSFNSERMSNYILSNDCLHYLHDQLKKQTLHELKSMSLYSSVDLSSGSTNQLKVQINSSSILTQITTSHDIQNHLFALHYFKSFFDGSKLRQFHSGNLHLQQEYPIITELCSSGDLVAISWKNKIILYNLPIQSDPQIVKYLQGHNNDITIMKATTKAPHLLATCDIHGFIRVWNFNPLLPKQQTTIQPKDRLSAAHMNAYDDNPNCDILYDQSINEFKAIHRNESNKLLWSDSANWLASYDSQNICLFNHVNSLQRGASTTSRFTIRCPEGHITDICFTPNDSDKSATWLIVSTDNSKLFIYNLQQERRTPILIPTNQVYFNNFPFNIIIG